MPKQVANVSKGRARLARPLLCVGASVLVLLAIAPAASAALRTPTLTSTNPVSPSLSTTPRIKGAIEESETKVVTFGAGSLRPITRAEGPTNVVRLYTDATCTGTIAGQGTVATLGGEGIIVDTPVEPDSVTFFYATQSDESETSLCSAGLRYRQVTAEPAAPIFTSVDPPSPANQNFPHLIGSADPDATVSIYANASCDGAALASGTGTQFGAAGIQVGVADNSETTFSANLSLAGFVTVCSAPLVYQEVTPPPDPGPDPGPGEGSSGGEGVAPATPVDPPSAPRLRTVPGGSANDNTPLVTGTAPGADTVKVYATASCDGAVVAKGSAAELAAGIPVRVVDNAAVILSAVSLAGDKTSKCSDPVVYTEDSLTPRTRITMGPAAKTAKRKAVIRFTDTTGSSSGTVFLCKVDNRKWRECSSPLRLKKLKPKRYVVRVKAADPAGNVEAKGAKRAFKVIRRR